MMNFLKSEINPNSEFSCAVIHFTPVGDQDFTASKYIVSAYNYQSHYSLN